MNTLRKCSSRFPIITSCFNLWCCFVLIQPSICNTNCKAFQDYPWGWRGQKELVLNDWWQCSAVTSWQMPTAQMLSAPVTSSAALFRGDGQNFFLSSPPKWFLQFRLHNEKLFIDDSTLNFLAESICVLICICVCLLHKLHKPHLYSIHIVYQ